MKIAFINHPECDYGGNMLYNGLVEMFGGDNILEYPPKMSYHGVTHYYSTPDISNGMTGPCPWSVSTPVPYRDENQAAAELQDAIDHGEVGLVVVESLRKIAVSTFKQFEDCIRRACIPVFLLESEDYPHLVWDRISEIRPNVVFKRELRKDMYDGPDIVVNGTRVVGFPFSCASTKIMENVTIMRGICDDMYDVSFMCGATNPVRQQVANAIRDNLQDLRINVRISPDTDRNNPPAGCLLSWDNYLHTMNRSLLTVSALGFGNDCVRFWEVPLLSCMVAQDPRLWYANEMQPGKHYIKFDGAGDIVDVIRHWHARKDEVAVILDNARRFVSEYHTNHARAVQMMQVYSDMTGQVI